MDQPEADLDPRRIDAILDALPGAFERAELGQAQVASGETIPLDELSDPTTGT